MIAIVIALVLLTVYGLVLVKHIIFDQEPWTALLLSDFYGIATNLMSAGIVAISLYWWAKWENLIPNRVLKRVLRLKRNANVFMIVPAVPVTGISEIKYAPSPSALAAVKELLPRIARVTAGDYDFDIAMGALDPEPLSLQQELILIGGPIPNKASDVLHDHITKTFTTDLRFDLPSKALIVTDEKGSRKFAFTDEGPDIARDHGLIICLDNPWSVGRSLLYIAGCRSFGTIASISILDETFVSQLRLPRYGVLRKIPIRWLNSKTVAGASFACVLEITLSKSHPAAPSITRVVEIVELNAKAA
jgi:hypothetical protein